MNFAVINARSATPKIDSIIENFNERDWDFAIISETWFVKGPVFESTIEELERGHGIGAICQNRCTKTGRNTGGGIAILFKKKRLSMKSYPFRRDGSEIIVGKTKLENDNRHIFVVGLYLPPSLKQNGIRKAIDAIRGVLTKIKTEVKNPIIIIGGNLNKIDITPAFNDMLDIINIPSPPTRGNERLDQCFSSIKEDKVKSSVLPPLESSGGTTSDHLILELKADLQRLHTFQWIKYRTREMTKKNQEKFREKYCAVDWERLLGGVESPDIMTGILHQTIDDLTNECFPWRDRKIKSTDDPWITDDIKKVIRRRKRKYCKQHRSLAWKEIKEESDRMIRESRRNSTARPWIR